jgi:hypothetical protein
MAAMVFMAAACTGADAVLIGNSVLAAGAAVNPPVLRAVDGIRGWKRAGPPERYSKDGLYGYIDGGAEIILQYGFRELAVSKYGPADAPQATKEIVLEIYRMDSARSAFGLYSTKLEGGEKAWPGLKPDNWIGPGQASLAKGEFLVNILGPECTEKELGEFMAAVERKVPGRGTARPRGMGWLQPEGMIPGSAKYIKGPLAAQNGSLFLEGEFWGFAGATAAKRGTEAYAAKYDAAPGVSMLVVIELGRGVSPSAVEDGVLATFNEYLQGVKRDGAMIEGRNEAGRWFLFRREGAVAALVLGEPDRDAAAARLEKALARASSKPST